MSEKKFLTTAEYGAKIGINASRVRQLCLAGRVPGAKKVGRDWLIPADATPLPGSKGPEGSWERS